MRTTLICILSVLMILVVALLKTPATAEEECSLATTGMSKFDVTGALYVAAGRVGDDNVCISLVVTREFEGHDGKTVWDGYYGVQGFGRDHPPRYSPVYAGVIFPSETHPGMTVYSFRTDEKEVNTYYYYGLTEGSSEIMTDIVTVHKETKEELFWHKGHIQLVEQ